MADQNIKLSTTPERTNSNSSNGGEKIVPHYLRASTGSCHDHCKYGKPHIFLTKPKRPVRRKVTPTSDYDEDDYEIFVLVDKKKAMIEKPKLSSDPETLEAEPDKKATPVKVKPASNSKTLSDESTKVIKSEKKATPKVNPPSESAKVIKPKVSSSMEYGDSSKREVTNTKDKSLSAKVSPKPTIVKLVSSPSSSSLRRNSITSNGKDSKVLTPKSATPKSAPLKSVKVTSSSSSATAKVPGSSSSVRDSDTKKGKDTGTSKVAVKKGIPSPIASLSPKTSFSRVTSLNARKTKSLKIVSPVKNLSKVRRSEPKQQPSSEIAPVSSSLVPKTSISRVSSLNARKTKSLKIVSPVKNLSKVRRSEPKHQPSSEIAPVSASVSPKASISRVTSLNSRKTKSLKIVSPVKNLSKVRRSEPKQLPSSEIAPVSASVPPKASISRVTSLNARKTKGLKIVLPAKNLSKVRRSEPKQQPSSEITLEKTLHVIKMETSTSPEGIESLNSVENESPSVQSFPPSSFPSIESVETKSSEECKTLETDKIEMPTAPSPPSSSSLLSPGSSSSSVSQSLSSHEEDLDGSEYTDSEAEDKTEEEHKTGTLEAEDKRKPRKARLLRSENKDGNPVKLSFRRGKVVDLQSESNGPHKLRFRRGTFLGENQKGDAKNRSYKKREETVSTSANLGSEKVVLRHQDVQGKKDLQGLFNNVIEQTASKLAETRRSKVKALVGAFETVISLQDKR